MKRRKHDSRALSVAIVSLGCAKNLVDSEKMMGALGAEGFIVTGEPKGADVVVVNTCSFIESAREESFSVIEEMLRLKKAGAVKYVVVAGCMPQRYAGRESELPPVDALAGVYRRGEIAEIIKRIARREDALAAARSTYSAPESVEADTARLRLTPRHYAYLRISEGCDNRCAYCTIPDIRGPLRSKPMEVALAEARELVEDGARELIIIGQDTTSWGADIYGRPRAAELVRALAEIGGVKWLRILYTHPAHYSEEFISLFRDAPKVLKYADIPIQHASDKILAAMRRRVTKAEILALIRRLRGAAPDITLRTSIIVGFPGETEDEFRELTDFLAEARFDRLGAFTYSREAGTPAAAMEAQVEQAIAQKRLDTLMRMQMDISQRANERFIGRELEAVVEGEADDGRIVARTYREAPDVDGVILVQTVNKRGQTPFVHTGDFIKTKITSAGPYDCEGVIA